MKKAVIAAFIMAAFALLAFQAAAAESAEISALPESLVTIEEDAFAGTSLDAVDLPDSVSRIGDNAFADNGVLMIVSLPDSLTEISGDPFAGSGNVVLSGAANSYGQFWAGRNGIRFMLEIAFRVKAEARQFAMMALNREMPANEAEPQTERVVQPHKEHRTGRTDGELKAAAYDGVAALYIQSRYFP